MSASRGTDLSMRPDAEVDRHLHSSLAIMNADGFPLHKVRRTCPGATSNPPLEGTQNIPRSGFGRWRAVSASALRCGQAQARQSFAFKRVTPTMPISNLHHKGPDNPEYPPQRDYFHILAIQSLSLELLNKISLE